MIRRSQAVETSDSSDCDSGRGVRVVRRSRRSTRGDHMTHVTHTSHLNVYRAEESVLISEVSSFQRLYIKHTHSLVCVTMPVHLHGTNFAPF